MGLKRKTFKEGTESQMLFCKRCGMFRGFYKEDDKWICCKCKKENKNGEVK